MKQNTIFILIFSILSLIPFSSNAQLSVVMSSSTTNIDGCIYPSGTIYDDGGAENDYSNSFDGTVNITVSSGITINLFGTYNTENSYDNISIYDGLDGTGTNLATLTGNSYITSISSSTGFISIVFHTDGSVVRSGFELSYSCSGMGSLCLNPISNLTASNITTSSALLSWNGTASSYHVSVNGSTITTSNSSYTLNSLSAGSVYQVSVSSIDDNLEPCCSAHLSFSTPCIPLTESSLPYLYDFEDASTANGMFNPCWHTSSDYLHPHPVSTAPRSGSLSAMFPGSSPYPQYLILPLYTDSLAKCMVSFYAFSNSTSNSIIATVGITTDPSNFSNFVPIGSTRIITDTCYHRYSFSLNTYSGHGGYVAIKVQTSENLFLDDVSLQIIPSCPSIYNLRKLSSIAGNIALAWDTDTISTSMPIRFDITATPSSGGTPIAFSVNESPALLSGLSPSSDYTFVVTPVCDVSSLGFSDSITSSTGCYGSSSSVTFGSQEIQTNGVPVNSSWGNTICQTIFTAAELTAAGITPGAITTISFTWTVNNYYAKEFSIYMAHTSLSNFNSYVNIPLGHTLVYSGAHPIGTHGTVSYDLSPAFIWDGISNIVITTIMNQPAGQSHSSSGFYGLSSSVSPSNNMSIYAYRDGSPYSISDANLCNITSYFRPNISFGSCNSTPSCTAPLAAITDVTDNSISIRWIPGYNETSWTIRYRRNIDTAWTTCVSAYSDTFYTITNLKNSTYYIIQIGSECSSIIPFATLYSNTLCGTSKLIYDDLFADYVTCYYGTFSNPTSYIGVYDDGYRSSNSRHTIHSDKAETDPRTGNILHTVPDGYCSSVRLGNWDYGGLAEAINYHLLVDTNDGDLLILKYAAVMEDPNHDPAEQPKFTFSITDDNGNIINPCYNATFISNADLGWNTGINNNVLWKDWTTVGVDLSAMHGMNINLHLTTYDCDQGGHYGYAYFVLDLDNKSVRSNSCLADENTFFAPLGFEYRWYSSTSNATLSTTDSLHVTTDGTYYCDLSFVGAPNDAEHANCYFTISAYAGVRYPYARFSAIPLDSSSCTVSLMRLINQSIVTSDAEHTDSIASGCESYIWRFDDGTTSTDVHPRHSFSVGPHTVTLFAMLADGQCIDSATYSFIAGAQCTLTDTIYQTICQGQSFTLCDSTLTEPGTYLLDTILPGDTTLIHVVFLTVNSTMSDTIDIDACQSYFWNLTNTTYTLDGQYVDHRTTSTGCDSITVLRLHILPSFDTMVYDTICNGQSISFNNTTVATEGITSVTLQTSSSPQCDSIVRLHLTVHEYIPIDTIATECGQFSWYGTTYTESGSPSFYINRNLPNECDTLKTLYLTLHPTYSNTIYDTIFQNDLPRLFCGEAFYNDTVVYHHGITPDGCDSLTIFNLHVIRNSYATFQNTFCENNLPLQWYHRIFYSAGTQYDTIVNQQGADSILTLILHIIPTVYDTIFQSICDNQTYLFEDSVYAPVAGIYTHQFTTQNGCDSLRTLLLSIRQTSHGDTVASACDHFVWHGQTFTDSDTLTIPDYTTNAAGCDSSITLYLSISHSTSSVVSAEACDTFTWYGVTYNIPPTIPPTHTLVNAAGCDSTISLIQLVIHQSDQMSAADTLCQNQLSSGYAWRDTTFYPGTTTGTYLFHRQNQYGCDSLTTLTLVVNTNTTSDVFDTIIENQSYTHTFNGIAFPNDTVAFVTIPNSLGCDSLITYHLHVRRNTTTIIDTAICDNQQSSFNWYGQSYAAQLRHTLLSSHGTDSLLILNITVLPTFESHRYDTVCDNQSLFFYGNNLAIAGNYSHTLTATNGCDSLINLHLSVNPTYTFHFYDSIYYGDTVRFEDSIYTAPGDYYHNYTSALGCDSVHVLHIYGRLLVNASRTDTLCSGDTILIGPWVVTAPGIYIDTLLSAVITEPDTIMTYTIVELPYLDATFDTSWVCGTYPHYILTPRTSAPYYFWSTTDASDRYYPGHENDSVLFAHPNELATYTLTLDYRQRPLCPSSFNRDIIPLDEVFARIETRPSELTSEQRDLIAFNRSRGNILEHTWQYWYNDDPVRTSFADQLSLTVPAYVDSLRIGLIVSSLHCTDTAYQDVEIRQYNIFFPNTFTPTQNTNNLFQAIGTGINSFELWIYERNGDLVFHSTDINQGWDGTHNGTLCKQGAYVYRCRYSEETNPRGHQTFTGTVLLLR